MIGTFEFALCLSMARPAKSENRNTRADILNAAATAFAAQGFHQASLADIGRDVGISARTILHHFASKEDLFDEVIRAKLFEPIGVGIRRALDSDMPVELKLPLIMQQVFDVWSGHPRLLSLTLAEFLRPSGMGKQMVLEYVMPLLTEIERFVKQDITPPMPANAPFREIMAQILLMHATRLSMQDVSQQVFEADNTQEIFRRLLDMLFQWETPRLA
ncbi:TetR family transcriptional regulator [Fluviicoccus keumensis]|uniref:TetR family transcriptional regulator n=2 Tax=Fluviicoccus keumensis TaxID=1435465 RepID=A0A4Q7ZDA2_9GAMM|nr:TetR family transcriptional regulator [Fluviicoccus keumensis]